MLAGAALHAQPLMRFEVASVKPSAPGDDRGRILSLSGGLFRVQMEPLGEMIYGAFGARSFEVVGIPAWVRSARYDIVARAAGNVSADKMWPMVLPLLQDRFKLQFHRETRQMPVYNLSVIKSGKLPAPKPENCRGNDPRLPLVQPPPGKRILTACGSTLMPIVPGGAELYGGSIGMKALAERLADTFGRPVADHTEFIGRFDLYLKFALDESLPQLAAHYAAAPGQASDPTGYPNIFTALRDQLGLKLESAKGPVEVIVIDRIERPSPD